MDKLTVDEAQKLAVALKEELKEMGITARSISMEDASTIYQQKLAGFAAQDAMKAAGTLILLSIAIRPTKAQAKDYYKDCIAGLIKQITEYGMETIEAEFDHEKAHTVEKLDLLCKTAIGL